MEQQRSESRGILTYKTGGSLRLSDNIELGLSQSESSTAEKPTSLRKTGTRGPHSFAYPAAVITPSINFERVWNAPVTKRFRKLISADNDVRKLLFLAVINKQASQFSEVWLLLLNHVSRHLRTPACVGWFVLFQIRRRAIR